MLQELSHALGMPYIRYEINGPCFENVPEIQGKYYGQAILSKHPIENYKAIEIHEPDIVDPSTFSDQTIDDGTEPHRKFVQKALINHDGALINFVNLHSIPFHLFIKNGSPLSINDPDLDKWRQRLNDIIRPNNNSPVILAGDFNNADCSIKELLPDLFEGNSLSNCIDFSSTPASVVFDRAKEQTSNQLVNTSAQSYQDTQVDYLLSSPSLRTSNKKVLVTPSDHPALFAQFII